MQVPQLYGFGILLLFLSSCPEPGKEVKSTKSLVDVDVDI